LVTVLFAVLSFNKEKGKIVRLKTFQTTLDTFSLFYSMPPGFIETRTNPRLQKNYFAIKNKKTKESIYYCLFPYAERLAKLRSCADRSLCLVPPPEHQFKELFNSLILDVSAIPDNHLKPYSKLFLDSIHADQGGYCIAPVNKALSTEHQFVTISYINKKEMMDIVTVKLIGSNFPVDNFNCSLSFKK
jgi:hypothetical protein